MRSVLARVSNALAWRLRAWRDRLLLARARRHRERLRDTVFIGITGSVGKTTTKDIAVAVLARHAPTRGNAASLNYLIDLARVVLATRRSERFAVVEIGISTPGSIDEKIALARPSIAALIVVGRDHIKAFGSMEAIAEEKGKLILALPPEGTAVLNADDPLVRAVGERARAGKLWFGSSPGADLRLVCASSSYPETLTLVVAYQGREHTCVTGLHGTHLTMPVMAALGLALAAGMPIEKAVAALMDTQTTPGRMQLVAGADGVNFIRDDYKAPHWSFQAALDHLQSARALRKVAVIGTLSDYSLSASKLYPKVARQAREVADLVVFVGPHALRGLKVRESENDRSIVGFTEIEAAHRFLQVELRAGDLVLLKGSNRADHLVRLLLARSQPVTCWTFGCGLNRFCDACPRIDAAEVVTLQRHADTANLAGHDGVDAAPPPEPAAPDGESSNGWLWVGLGNPGPAYENTPHNVGFAVLDRLAGEAAAWTRCAEGLVARLKIKGHDIWLLKPGTPLNLCGPAVESMRRRQGLRLDRVVVVHDDTDIAPGDVRLKSSGSDGGHKGLRSVIAAFGNDGLFKRVRIGVRGDIGGSKSARNVVLTQFDDAGRAAIQGGLERAADMLGSMPQELDSAPKSAPMSASTSAPPAMRES